MKFAEAKTVVHQRDGFRCQECTRQFTRAEVDVHHLVPRALGGSDDPSNLITLCDACHAARHPNLQVGLARRFIEKWGVRLARFLDSTSISSDAPERIGHALRLLGHSRLRTGQLEVILAIMRGESVLVVRPTGFGKTLCFWLPSICTAGTAYVFSPLKALMNQQVASLTRHSIPSTFINGDLSPNEKAQRYELLEKNALKLLYITPERLSGTQVKAAEMTRICNITPSYIVVDEAHCVDRWGDDFRPAYSDIGTIRGKLGSPPVLAFTATATIGAQQRIIESLGIQGARVFVDDVDRPNIGLVRICSKRQGDRSRQIANLLVKKGPGRAMLFVPTVKKGLQAQAELSELGWKLEFYHGKLKPSEREFIQKRFQGEIEPAIETVICTNAFGMGLDIPDVRLVVHWQQPASVEDYLQEYGRAGRDGKASLAVLFYEKDLRWDVGLLEFMIRKSTTTDPAVAEKKVGQVRELSCIVRMGNKCFRRQLLDCFIDRRSKNDRRMSQRILSWIFERRSTVGKIYFCCDHCDPQQLRSILAAAT